jgi:hypothetical protein
VAEAGDGPEGARRDAGVVTEEAGEMGRGAEAESLAD